MPQHRDDHLRSALADRYRIEREVGAGGMATVYLAHDLRHERQVAVKVLKPELAAVIGAERFLAEIKTTANLQHPHILPLFDSGTVEGTVFYVMPFVEGESLRDRLAREKQLPIDEALRIAREVGEALEYAHGHGVIHRDIKPENILLQRGHASVADFGIALAATRTGGGRMTETGMSLGTPQYMAPEQAMGEREITPRADVYALGCVLYEMLMGEAPFTGTTAQAIVAKVLTERPAPLQARRDRVPAHVEDAVLTALEKLPADRFGSAGEFVAAIGDTGFARTSDAGRAATSGRAERRDGRWAIAVGVLGTAVLGLATAVVVLSRATPEPRMIRVELQPEPSTGDQPVVVVGAPDGRSYFYCTSAGAVMLRRWEDRAPQAVPGVEGGCTAAAFSPDGGSIAIVGLTSSLSIISVNGDVLPRQLGVEGAAGDEFDRGAIDWASDGQLYVAGRSGVSRISPTDGRRERIARPDSGLTWYGVDVLPDARRAVVVTGRTVGTLAGDAGVGMIDLGTGRVDPITPGIVGRYIDRAHLLVVRSDGSMDVVPIEPRTGRAIGAQVTLPDSVGRITEQGARITSRATGGFWQGAVDVAPDGTLLYWRSTQSGESRPVIVDRQAVERPLAAEWIAINALPRFSPEGSRISVEVTEPGAIRPFVRDLASGATRRLEMPGTLNGRPIWTPDGRGLTFISGRSGPARAHSWRLDDDVTTQLPLYEARAVFGLEWSRDGRWLLLRTDNQVDGKADIMAVRPGVDTVARPIVAMPDVSEYAPALSPDGRWLAYVSNQDGRYDVRVTAFPEARERWNISSAGGSEPTWSHDGKELFYVSDDGYLMSASVATGADFRVTGQRRLFSVAPYTRAGPVGRNYDVSRDGRFLMLRPVGESALGLVAVHGWARSVVRLAGDR